MNEKKPKCMLERLNNILTEFYPTSYSVKLVRAKLPAMAAGIQYCRQNYVRMQAKISAGNDCLRFPQVTGGNLPALAGNLGETFIVRVRAVILKSRDASFCPVPNTLTEATTFCL